MMSEVTSPSLLARIRNPSDEDSWRQFLATYGPLIEGWLRRHGVPAAQAEDVRQEVMLVVMRAARGFEHSGRPGAFRNWLRKVTANRLRAAWRSRDRQPAVIGGDAFLEMAQQLAAEQSPLSLAWSQEHDRHVLEQLLKMVTRRFQPRTIKAFRGVVFQERKAEQVGEQLGMTANAVRIAVSRVLGELRQLGAGLID